MNNQFNKQLVFVIYDGINNSVFQSQVLKPLLDSLDEDLSLLVTLVSFERKKIKKQELEKRISGYDRLRLVIFKRPPFAGKVSLFLGVNKLLNWLKKNNYGQIIARGPLAGFVCIRALQKIKNKNTHLTVQARGLCAEEYRYAHESNKKNILKSLWYSYIKNALHAIEKSVYSSKAIHIECVSPALKEYLVKTFDAYKDNMTIASKDIPEKINLKLRGAWRIDVRKKLGIPKNAHVFCYSGSYKPWQCVDETIEQFSCELEKNENAFLLVLTRDEEKFIEVLEKQSISKNRYKVISVQPDHLLHYLSAADTGFILRKKDIVNWVSRPTKILEYQAVGLKIVHNNTVGWLVDSKFNESLFSSSRK